MTVSQYLDLAYAVIVDEHVRRGESVFDVLERTNELAARAAGVAAPVATASGRQQQAPRRVQPEQGIGGPGEPISAADLANQEALAILTGAMGSVQGGFK